MKIGFEQEFFLRNEAGEFVLVPKSGIPRDESGFLAEARSEPHHDAIFTAFSLLAATHKLEQLLEKHVETRGLQLGRNSAVERLPAALLRAAYRQEGKQPYPAERGNLYGKDYAATDRKQRAGFHIHFSAFHEREIRHEGGRVEHLQIHTPLNMPRIILALDQHFAKQIKEAKRIPGLYEMKPHGFEYRSLPTTVSPVEVGKFLLDLKI